MTSSIKKTAVDAATKEYWENFYTNGYGSELCKPIGRRIAAALKLATKRTASTDAPKLQILAAVATSAGQCLEGIATYADSSKVAFVATFDAEADIIDFDTVGTK